MKTILISLTLSLLALSAAQSNVDVDSSAAQVLVRASSALGVELPEGDLLGHLQALEGQGVIESSTSASMRAALTSGELSSDTLNIFLADVLNGQAPALSAQQASAFLADLGVTVAANEPNVDTSVIDSIFTNPDFANAIGDAYDAPASPINATGN